MAWCKVTSKIRNSTRNIAWTSTREPSILVSPTPSSRPAHRWMPLQRSNVSEVARCLMGNHDGCHGTTVYLPRFTIEINQMTGKIQAIWCDDFFPFPIHVCMVYFPMHGWLDFCGFSSRYILYRIHVWSISTIFYGKLGRTVHLGTTNIPYKWCYGYQSHGILWVWKHQKLGVENLKKKHEDSQKKRLSKSGPLCFKKQTVYVQSNWDPYYKYIYIIWKIYNPFQLTTNLQVTKTPRQVWQFLSESPFVKSKNKYNP